MNNECLNLLDRKPAGNGNSAARHVRKFAGNGSQDLSSVFNCYLPLKTNTLTVLFSIYNGSFKSCNTQKSFFHCVIMSR